MKFERWFALSAAFWTTVHAVFAVGVLVFNPSLSSVPTWWFFGYSAMLWAAIASGAYVIVDERKRSKYLQDMLLQRIRHTP